MATNNSSNYSPTQYNVQVGGASGTLTNIAPSATTGIPVISQGASANPAFGTAVVAGGGTGANTLTGVLIGNGTGPVTGNITTQYNTLVAGASNSITSIPPSPTSGVPLISQGSTSNPTYGTALVAGGGTGSTLFTAYAPVIAGTTATGAFQSASTGLSNAGYVLTSNGSSALPSFQAVSGGSGITTINGDTGFVTGTTVTLSGDGAGNFAGSTIRFLSLTGNTTMILSATDNNSNTIMGKTAGNATISGSQNVGFGESTFGVLSSGSNNTAIGEAALGSLSTGSSNVSVGTLAGSAIDTGSNNVFIGDSTGTSYTTSETNNILIGSGVAGVAAESNVTRIGVMGTQSSCYVAGVASVSVSNKNYVTIDTSTGQMGSDSGPSGFSWSVITSNQTAAINNGYICNKAGTLALALPATAAVGSIIEVTGINTATGWQITQASGQQVFFGTSSTTSGATGTLTSSAIRDSIRMVCVVANTTWQVLSSIGNITVV